MMIQPRMCKYFDKPCPIRKEDNPFCQSIDAQGGACMQYQEFEGTNLGGITFLRRKPEEPIEP